MSAPLLSSAVEAMYGRPVAALLDELNLVEVGQERGTGSIADGLHGLAMATTRYPLDLSGESAVVVGGGCIGYSNGRLAQVRADYIADLIAPLAVAALTGRIAVIYLPVGEELVTAPSHRNRWTRFADELERCLAEICATAPDVTARIVRTDKPDISALLDAAAARLAPGVSEDELAALYELQAAAEPRRRPGTARLSQYRRTLATYQPGVIAQILGVAPPRSVLVAENLHQARAVNLAARLSGGTAVAHIAHLPAPALTGAERMCVVDPGEAAFAAGFEDIASVGSPLSRTYWAAIAETYADVVHADLREAWKVLAEICRRHLDRSDQ